MINIIAGEDELEREPIGIWGQRHLDYIKNHSKVFYNKILIENKLYNYLIQINQDAEDMFNLLVKQLTAKEGVNEELKASNQLKWIGQMNNIQQGATEFINSELIYT